MPHEFGRLDIGQRDHRLHRGVLEAALDHELDHRLADPRGRWRGRALGRGRRITSALPGIPAGPGRGLGHACVAEVVAHVGGDDDLEQLRQHLFDPLDFAGHDR